VSRAAGVLAQALNSPARMPVVAREPGEECSPSKGEASAHASVQRSLLGQDQQEVESSNLSHWQEAPPSNCPKASITVSSLE
jgi:hypothetical protein